MGCETVKMFGDGGFGIVCTRGSRTEQCSEPGCRRKSVILCDYAVGPDKTCDRPACQRHSTCIGTEHAGTPDADTLDYCREHTAMARPHQVAHGHLFGQLVKIRWDQLSENAQDHCAKRGYGPNTVAKVVMVSGMGDLGLTNLVDTDRGYNLRLNPEEVQPVTHVCHAHGCSAGAHPELPFCKKCFGVLPEVHRNNLWKGRRGDHRCGACHIELDAEVRLRRAEGWDELYHLALAILIQLRFEGCGAPPPYQDDEGFCWSCGIPDALRYERIAKKAIVKFELTL